MNKTRSWLASAGLSLSVIGLLAACGPRPAQPTNTPLPSPSATIQQLPPTWTPGTPPTDAPETQTPVITLIPALGVTALTGLPPTWTPMPFITETEAPSPTDYPTLAPFELTATAAVPPTATLTDIPQMTQEGTARPPIIPTDIVYSADCPNFTVNTNLTNERINFGDSAIVTWNRLSQAAIHYQLWVLAPDRNFITNIITNEASVKLAASVFNLKGVYGWELVAFAGDTQACPHLSGVIIVS